MHTDMFCVADVIVVLAERKLTSYVYAVVWYQSRVPAIQFHSSAASATVLENHEAPLAFRGMEEKLRIFNKTQGVQGSPMYYHNIEMYQNMYMRRYVSDVAADMLIRTSLWAFIASESESHSGSVRDKLNSRYDDR
ncbi:hypothetical protein TIFTF001_053396 [Ficus carica]|uniref:Uncharacterized protein n=1 Tax=Ficus carica TaxID=3494 RepID=A0AA88JGI6_FICCA|nr:hypothetical protein TIFTF001_053396 [Ficus carica]